MGTQDELDREAERLATSLMERREEEDGQIAAEVRGARIIYRVGLVHWLRVLLLIAPLCFEPIEESFKSATGLGTWEPKNHKLP